MRPRPVGHFAVMPGRREWIASVPFSSRDSFAGRLSKLGGTLSLTDEALVFTPLWGLGRRVEIRLADIADVSEFATKPARLRVTRRSGEPLVFIVVPSRTTTASSKDTSARDEAVATIRAALQALSG